MKKIWIILILLCFLGFFLLGFGISMIGGDYIEKYYFYFNPPVYNPPTEKTSVNSVQLIKLINDKRQIRSLKTLKENKTLSYVAYLRVKNIFDNQEYTHQATRSGLTYSNVAKKVGYFYRVIGENLAIGYESEEQILTAWEKSKIHADVMFDKDYSEIGTFTLKGNFLGNTGNATALILGKQ